MKDIIPLENVVAFYSGGTPSRAAAEYYDGTIPWITGADIDSDGYIHPRSFITPEAISRSATREVPAGTVLLVTRTSIGKVAIAREALTFSQDITAIVPNNDYLDKDYLRHFLISSSEELSRHARGATIKGVTRETLRSLMLQLPPKDKQQQIARVLDQVNELRSKRRQAVTLLADLSRSIFFDMFGNTSTGSETVPVSDLATNIRTGPFGSDLLHSEFVDSGIAVLGIDNAVNNEFTWSQRRYITSEKYQKLARYRVYPGDLLITIMGTCGRCAIVPDDIPVAINTKHLCCITLDKSRCLPDFLHAYFLMHPTARRYLERTAKGAIMSGLNATIIKSLPVQLPSLAVQERFAKISLQLREQRSRFGAQAREFDELFKSLQQRAFRNEL